MLNLLKKPLLNNWSLFWLISVPVSLVMLAAILRVETWDGPTVSSMIQLSVRMAIPWLFVAFACSSMPVLFPGPFSLWLMRNRKIFGLAFAAGMSWQGFFILWLVTIHSDYYINEVYVLRDAIEGVVGYSFLAAMIVTSFQPGRKLLSPKGWKRLHKTGIYFLWAYAFSTYWWAVSYYPDPVPLDYLYYWAGFNAWTLRIAAWTKKQIKRSGATPAESGSGLVPMALSAGFALAGLTLAALGRAWFPVAEPLLNGYSFTRWPELYLPYWPFEPFLFMLLFMAAAWCLARVRT
jgi:hypothetical protein